VSGGAVEETNPTPGFDYSGSGPKNIFETGARLWSKPYSEANIELTAIPRADHIIASVEQMLPPACDRHPTDIAPVIPAVA
jgi:hypothetical protein